MSTKTTTPAATAEIALSDTYVVTVKVDASTTPVTADADTVADVATTYRECDTKGKIAMKATIKKSMMAFVMAGNMDAAQFCIQLEAALTTTKPVVEINPTDVLTDAVAELEMAAWLIRVGMITPEGLDVNGIDFETITWHDTSDQSAMIDELGEARFASIQAAAKTFAGSKRTRSTGPQADIGQAILSAFDGMAAGSFLTVSEIANKAGMPKSTGAIAARLFPTTRRAGKPDVARECTVKGIRAGLRDGSTGPKGAFLI